MVYLRTISIVTINLNNEIGLEKSILSVISQNVLDHIQYVVVDGESNDGSRKIIEKYANYIDTYLIERDEGIFDAMNKGVALSSGDFVYFLNSGDEFASDNVINNVINEMSSKSSNCNIYAGDVEVFFDGESFGLLNLEPWVVHQSAFVKLSLLKKFKFNTSYKIYGDLDLWRRIYINDEYSIFKMNFLIARMELDGIGSHPRYSIDRMKDKFTYVFKYGGFFQYFLSSVFILIGFFIYILFGARAYFFTYIRNLRKLKKSLKR